jgi:hypothetical protein
MAYIKEKISPFRRVIFQIFWQKNKNKIETSQNKDKFLLLNNLIYILPIQKYMNHINFQKICQNHWTLLINVTFVAWCQCPLRHSITSCHWPEDMLPWIGNTFYSCYQLEIWRTPEKMLHTFYSNIQRANLVVVSSNFVYIYIHI